jgi:hypothetical protein
MSTLTRSDTIQERGRIFAALALRNRLVVALRLAVPAFGIVVLGGLVLQLYLASRGDDFGFADIRIDRENLVVDSPSYSNMGTDGSSYLIEAASARSALGQTDIIDLVDVVLSFGKPTGGTITARTDAARLRTTDQLVIIEGVARIDGSDGMRGTLADVTADVAAEAMVGNGAVDVTFADGTRLEAAGMSYDVRNTTWQFERATLTLPATPEAETGTAEERP